MWCILTREIASAADQYGLEHAKVRIVEDGPDYRGRGIGFWIPVADTSVRSRQRKELEKEYII